MNHETLQNGARRGGGHRDPQSARQGQRPVGSHVEELRAAMRWADETDAVRVVILRGAGRHFTAGIDLAMLAGIEREIQDDCPARSRGSCAGSSSISRIA